MFPMVQFVVTSWVIVVPAMKMQRHKTFPKWQLLCAKHAKQELLVFLPVAPWDTKQKMANLFPEHLLAVPNSMRWPMRSLLVAAEFLKLLLKFCPMAAISPQWE